VTKLCEIDGRAWKAALNAVYVAAAKKDPGRPALECILLKCASALRLTAADNYRLHIATIPVGDMAGCSPDHEVLVNAIALHKVKIVTGASVCLDLATDGASLSVNGQDLPTVNECYPAFEQVIPLRFAWSFTIDAEELRESVKFLSPMAKNLINLVVLDGDVLSASDPEHGDASCHLETLHIVTGAMPRMSFNWRYLRDALIGESQVTVSGNTATQPIVIDGLVARRVIMPMEVRND